MVQSGVMRPLLDKYKENFYIENVFEDSTDRRVYIICDFDEMREFVYCRYVNHEIIIEKWEGNCE